MPHIIVEYSENLLPTVNIGQVLTDLHEALAAQGIDRKRIKTRSIELAHSVVGDEPLNVGRMIHATLLLLEGRTVETKKSYAQPLHDILTKAVRANFPDCAVTLEVRDMVKDTYIL